MKASTLALSIAGGLGALGVGYLIWRHETILRITQQQQAQQAAAAAQQQQQADYLQNEEIQAMIEQQGGYGATYGSTYNAGNYATDYSQVSGTTLASIPQDSNLQAILSAFLGSSSTTAAASSSASSPTGAASSNTSTQATPATSTAILSGIGTIPASLITGSTVSAINQTQASNPLITSQVGAASGTSRAATDASHTLATATGQ